MSEVATDPIAIASLVASLPELESKYVEAKEAAEAANKALNALQARIDTTLDELRDGAPEGSRWGIGRKSSQHAARVLRNQAMSAAQNAGMQNAVENMLSGAGQAMNIAPQVMIKPLGVR